MQISTDPPTRIQVLGHHPLAAQCLLNVLSSDSELRHLLVCPPTSDFNPDAQDTSPRLFIVDTYLLPLELSKVIRTLTVRRPESRFLALLPAEGCNDEDILRMLYLGFDGVVEVAEGWEEELVTAIKAVLAGDLWAPRRVLAEYVRQTNWLRSDQRSSRFSLTAREGQVLELAIRRFSNKEIAGALRISERTAKFHIANIFAKLRVDSRRNLPAAIGATSIEPPSRNTALVPLVQLKG